MRRRQRPPQKQQHLATTQPIEVEDIPTKKSRGVVFMGRIRARAKRVRSILTLNLDGRKQALEQAFNVSITPRHHTSLACLLPTRACRSEDPDYTDCSVSSTPISDHGWLNSATCRRRRSRLRSEAMAYGLPPSFQSYQKTHGTNCANASSRRVRTDKIMVDISARVATARESTTAAVSFLAGQAYTGRQSTLRRRTMAQEAIDRLARLQPQGEL